MNYRRGDFEFIADRQGYSCQRNPEDTTRYKNQHTQNRWVWWCWALDNAFKEGGIKPAQTANSEEPDAATD